jgi:hypothetical protein
MIRLGGTGKYSRPCYRTGHGQDCLPMPPNLENRLEYRGTDGPTGMDILGMTFNQRL